MVKFTKEAKLEEDLINQLIKGESQWIYRQDLSSEEALWDNFKTILERNNRQTLKDRPLTTQEFLQIRAQLTFSSFYEAAIWLAGENGVAKVQVQREDATLGTIRLNVINRADIAGGTTVYEVINQYTSRKTDAADRHRFFDVTLLINGLPLIHIELKNRAHPFMDAFRQIKKYLKEDKFTGIFSAVQMFVVSNGTDTRYIASNSYSKINEKFLSKWVDQKNEPVTDYLSFAKAVLSIPQAHKLVTQYSVTDRENEALILLRPYQIHAIEAIKRASSQQLSGFVWHTTGSGKTLTSYKVAGNLLQIPSLDKTIFIVDRRDLDQQTTSSFASYAEFDPVSIDETDNVNDLIRKLSNDDRTVVITTIQKIDHLMKRMAEAEQDVDTSKQRQKQYAKIKGLRAAFIVDECHRAVTPSKKEEIDAVFAYALWYGFTGTPIFGKNARAEKGDLARTTAEQYSSAGNRPTKENPDQSCLHSYTVKEAINDQAVLGFQVEYKKNFKNYEYERENILALHHPQKKISTLSKAELDALIPAEYFQNDAHYLKVIDSIINESIMKLGLSAENGGKAYGAMLTVPSIAIAQRYYELFKEVIAGEASVKVSERVRAILPDFPKVAITYSVSENDESSITNQEKMKASIADYNTLYGTNFKLENMRAYNQDVNNRLARKQERFHQRKEQIDIIIVVDRLLTGFDAPCISTLFIDRPPMRPQDIIQAFSRTNRLFDQKKTFGQIVTFQTPDLYEEKVNEALVLYSNGGENFVLAPTFEESSARLKEAVEALRLIAATPEKVDDLLIEEKRQFAKAYQALDRQLSAIVVYSDFKPEMLVEEFNLPNHELENYHAKYQNVLEELRKEPNDDPDIEPLDIEYDLQTHRMEEINYRYILSLIQRFMPKEDENLSADKEYAVFNDPELQQKVDEYIQTLQEENPKLAGLMQQLWMQVKSNPASYRGKQVNELLEEMIDDTFTRILTAFAQKWALKPAELRFMVDHYNPYLVDEKQNGEDELQRTSDYECYKANTENPVSKLRYWRTVKEAYIKMITEDILPLRIR